MLHFSEEENIWFNKIFKQIKYKIPQNVKRDFCVDIGCNVGAFVIKNKERFDNFICIEAAKENVEIIERKFKEYNIVNAKLFHRAAYKTSNEKVVLRHWGDGSHKFRGNASIVDYIDNRTTHSYLKSSEEEFVISISLEDILLKCDNHINYLKIDIEGGEYDFLYEKDLSKIDFIGAEIHVQLGDKKEKLMEYLDVYFTNECTHNSTQKEYLFTNRNLI